MDWHRLRFRSFQRLLGNRAFNISFRRFRYSPPHQFQIMSPAVRCAVHRYSVYGIFGAPLGGWSKAPLERQRPVAKELFLQVFKLIGGQISGPTG